MLWRSSKTAGPREPCAGALAVVRDRGGVIRLMQWSPVVQLNARLHYAAIALDRLWLLALTCMCLMLACAGEGQSSCVSHARKIADRGLDRSLAQCPANRHKNPTPARRYGAQCRQR